MNNLVSITITTKNEEKNIENCINSILSQTYQPIELIVVDNSSTDKTQEISKRYTKKVFTKGPERSAQRNHGMIGNSGGKYVMFVDADMILSPSLIAEAVALMEKDSLMALHIPEIVLGKKYFSKVRRFERRFYDGTPIDGARLFLREAFVRTGGFDITMSGPEDWDIDKKIKLLGPIGLLKGKKNIHETMQWKMRDFIISRGVKPENFGPVIFHNESEFDLGKYVSKKGYYAKSFDGYISKWGKDDPDIRKQFGFGYRFLGVFLEKGKWTKLLLHPLLAFGMYFLRFLVGIAYITRKK